MPNMGARGMGGSDDMGIGGSAAMFMADGANMGAAGGAPAQPSGGTAKASSRNSRPFTNSASSSNASALLPGTGTGALERGDDSCGCCGC